MVLKGIVGRICSFCRLNQNRPAKPLGHRALRIPPSSRLSPPKTKRRIKFFLLSLSSPHSLPPPLFTTHSSCLSPSETRRRTSRSHRKAPPVLFFSLSKAKKNILTCRRTPQNTPANNAPISSHAQQPGVSSIEEGKSSFFLSSPTSLWPWFPLF